MPRERCSPGCANVTCAGAAPRVRPSASPGRVLPRVQRGSGDACQVEHRVLVAGFGAASSSQVPAPPARRARAGRIGRDRGRLQRAQIVDEFSPPQRRHLGEVGRARRRSSPAHAPARHGGMIAPSAGSTTCNPLPPERQALERSRQAVRFYVARGGDHVGPADLLARSMSTDLRADVSRSISEPRTCAPARRPAPASNPSRSLMAITWRFCCRSPCAVFFSPPTRASGEAFARCPRARTAQRPVDPCGAIGPHRAVVVRQILLVTTPTSTQ